MAQSSKFIEVLALAMCFCAVLKFITAAPSQLQSHPISEILEEKVLRWRNLEELKEGGWELEPYGTTWVVDVRRPTEFNAGLINLDSNSSMGIFGAQAAERYGAAVLNLKLKDIRTRPEICGAVSFKLGVKFYDQSYSRFSVFPTSDWNRVSFVGAQRGIEWRSEEHLLFYSMALDIIAIQIPLNQDNYVIFDEITLSYEVSPTAPCP